MEIRKDEKGDGTITNIQTKALIFLKTNFEQIQ